MESLKEVVVDCFTMTLAQIRHLNPTVSLNIARYGYQPYVKDGVLVLPPPSVKDESISFVDKDGGGEKGPEADGGGQVSAEASAGALLKGDHLAGVLLEGEGALSREAAPPS